MAGCFVGNCTEDRARELELDRYLDSQRGIDHEIADRVDAMIERAAGDAAYAAELADQWECLVNHSAELIHAASAAEIDAAGRASQAAKVAVYADLGRKLVATLDREIRRIAEFEEAHSHA